MVDPQRAQNPGDELNLVISPSDTTRHHVSRRTDDRRVISGVVHVLKTGCRWQGLPGRVRAFHDRLQSLSPLDDARDLASVV
jgi:hypothetical protein